jgi:hypothetical protein
VTVNIPMQEVGPPGPAVTFSVTVCVPGPTVEPIPLNMPVHGTVPSGNLSTEAVQAEPLLANIATNVVDGGPDIGASVTLHVVGVVLTVMVVEQEVAPGPPETLSVTV